MDDLEKIAETYSKAIDHLRNTSKWILSVFATVAGVLVAGLQLSNLGKIETHYLTIAAGAFFVALMAVLVIIGMTIKVLGTGTVTEKILRDFVPKSKDINLNDPLLLGGYKKVDEFLDAYKKVNDEYVTAQKSRNQKTVEQLQNQITRLDYSKTYLLYVAKYAMVLKAFKDAIRGLFVCAVIASIAIGIFAWATSQGQKPPTQTIFQSPPSSVSLTLTAAGRKLMKDSLGEQCVDQAQIPVIMLSLQDGRIDVVTTPSAKCRVARFNVGTDIGKVQ